MGDSSKQICRLCLDITPSCESEHIDEIKKDILEVLLINVDFEISDYAVVCNRCLEKLMDCFDFKAHCIQTVMEVDFKLCNKEEVNHKSTGHESSHICRFCMSLIGDETFNHTALWKGEVLLKDMIRNCFAEMDLNAVHEPVICKQCLNSMKKYHEFMQICEEVEQRIEHFRQVAGHGTVDRIPLEDLLKFKDCNVLGKPRIIKKECSDVDNVNENVMKCVKDKEAVNIKCEEIHIKDEFNEMESGDLDQPEDNENIGKDGFSKTRRAKRNAKKGRKYFCSKCPYSSERRDHVKKHMRRHSDNESYQCFVCPFITNNKFSFKTHMMSHRGATKAYGCPQCPYETDHIFVHRLHSLKHKDESEVEMQKCPLCPFRTKRKSSLVMHQLVHLNPKEIPMYKCAKCEYETKYKNNLVLHLKMHQDPDTIRKFKCDKCPYWAKWPAGIRKHMIVHSDQRPFSCDQCTYSGKCKRLLLRHKKRIHQTDAERKMYKCKLCSYQTKYNVSLKAHMAKSHMDPTVPVMKCAHCSYETTRKFCLSRHMSQRHTTEN